MPENTSNIIQLLRRWLSGEIRAPEERALDRAAEDDPFLRDALEGYRRHPEEGHAEVVERIRERVQAQRRRGGSGFVRWLPRIAAAAVLLLLIGGALWYLRLPGGGGAPLLSEREEAAPEQLEQLKPEDMGKEEADTPFQENLAEATQAYPPRTEAAQPRPEEEPEVLPVPAPPEPESEGAIALERSTEAGEPAGFAFPSIQTDSISEMADIPAVAPSLRALRRVSPEDTLRSPRRLAGQITTTAGQPVAGAQILLPGTSFGTKTDTGGRFQLEVPAYQQGLVINRPGYTDALIPIEQRNFLHIALRKETPTDSAQKRSALSKALPATSGAYFWPSPQPENGFDTLEAYIQTNQQYPEEALAPNLEGHVLLQFTVQPGGELTDFKALESPGEAFSKEAIRLLQEGPAWSLPENRTTPMPTTYQIGFKQ